MIRVIICGINGAMGQVLAATVKKTEGMELAFGVDVVPDLHDNGVPVFTSIMDSDIPGDVIIDFSRPTALEGNLAYAKKHNIPVIIATTGCSAEDRRKITKTSKSVPVFFAANMSLGVNMQFELVREVADFFGPVADIEIVERHHNRKVDAPSGTAVELARIINESQGGKLQNKYGRTPSDGRREKNELGIHSIRGGTFVGEHDVMFITDSEVLTVSHHAQTKQVFADGAVRAAKFIVNCEPGLYSMKDIVYQTRTMTGISRIDGVTLITVRGGEGAGFAYDVLKRVADEGIVVDVIIMAESGGISFSVPDKDGRKTMELLSGEDAYIAEGLSKISVEGLGMELMHGVATGLFAALKESGADVRAVTTSETRMEFIVDGEYADTAYAAVRKRAAAGRSLS